MTYGYQVDFEPIGRRVNCTEEETLLEAAQRAGVMLAVVCGGVGICGHCKVQVIAIYVSPVGETESDEFSAEEISSGWRLACQTLIHADLRVHVPADSLATAQSTQTEGLEVSVALDPAVSEIQVDIPIPAIADVRSDADRVRDALRNEALVFPTSVLRSQSPALREAHFHPTLFLRGNQAVAIRTAGTRGLGLVVNIGTTKLAGYLSDLKSGQTLASAGRMNPQIAYGEDVMARITHAMTHPQGAEQLRGLMVDAVNGLARDLCEQAGQRPSDIVDAVVVGNTAMHHLFLGLPVR